jgi:threonine/homoserine/homoserine lactone efflux protein
VSVQLWLGFVAASAVLLVIPGPTILTVISYSIAQGGRANVPLIAAVALGDSTALMLSILGLGSLLAASAMWFTIVKWAGGAYLLYLGFRLLRAGVSPLELVTPAINLSRCKLFANTYFVTALNPKGIIFFVAFLASSSITMPRLRDSSGCSRSLSPSWPLQMQRCTHCSPLQLARCWYHPRAQRRFNWAGGSLLCAVGIWALQAKLS